MLRQRNLVCAKSALVIGFLLAASGAAYGHVRLNAPNGGERLAVGCTYTIEWTVVIQHSTLNWDLWYSTTGPNGPWITIEMDLPRGNTSVGSIHTYEWTVPNAVSEQVRVRVRMDNSGTDYLDISNADFAIQEPLTGDLNCDCVVNLADLGILLADFGCMTGSCVGDLNGDGYTDLADLGILLSVFGSSCP